MPRLIVKRFPKTDGELWHFIKKLWGIEIPRDQVCEDHVAPFDAFAEAYFARSPLSIWLASRGLGGKSFLLGTLALSEAVTLGVEVTVLGGSASQSLRVHECTQELWNANYAPRYLLEKEPTRYETKLSNRAHIRALMASQRSVRGPHPARLRLDEIDEMDMPILEAALGQPMPQRGVESQTVCSSTHQYPDGCHAQGTPVLTHRGEVPIEKVRVGDYVPTRAGWKRVLDTVYSGYQEVGRLELSNGRVLRSTLDHPIAVGDEWVPFGELVVGQEVCGISPDFVVAQMQMGTGSHAEALTPTTGLLSGLDPLTRLADPAPALVEAGVGGGVFVPLGAMGLPSVDGGGAVASQDVVPLGDGFQVIGVDTASVPAKMVSLHSFGDGADEVDVAPAMSGSPVIFAVDSSVAVSLGSLPFPTFTDDLGSAQEPVTVVSIHTGECTTVPTYDLHIEDRHEYVAGGVVVHNTVTEMLRRSGEQPEWAKRVWCYKESMGTEKNPGWLSPVEVRRKKAIIPKAMWDAEFEMQEPSFDGRAIDTDAIDAVFSPEVGTYKGDPTELIVMEGPEEHGRYITGVDWAKEKDWTVIRTFKDEGMVWREIAFERCNRMAWPIMVGKVNARMSMFPGMLAYDNTGLGSVVADYLDIPSNCESVGIDMIGRRREVLFSEYISAIEGRHFLCPRIDYAYTEHRYAKSEDFYGSGHPPDSVVAGALAWHVRNEGRRMSLPPLLVEEFARNRSPWRMT